MCSCNHICECDQTKPEILNIKWPYGHVTSDGKAAKYLGPYMAHNFTAWLIDNTVWLLAATDKGKIYCDTRTIINKPAPEKWRAVFKDGLNRFAVSLCDYDSQKDAMADKSWGGAIAAFKEP